MLELYNFNRRLNYEAFFAFLTISIPTKFTSNVRTFLQIFPNLGMAFQFSLPALLISTTASIQRTWPSPHMKTRSALSPFLEQFHKMEHSIPNSFWPTVHRQSRTPPSKSFPTRVDSCVGRTPSKTRTRSSKAWPLPFG